MVIRIVALGNDSVSGKEFEMQGQKEQACDDRAYGEEDRRLSGCLGRSLHMSQRSAGGTDADTVASVLEPLCKRTTMARVNRYGGLLYGRFRRWCIVESLRQPPRVILKSRSAWQGGASDVAALQPRIQQEALV